MFHNELHNLQHSLGGSSCETNLRDSMYSKGWHMIKLERAKSNARNRDTARRKKNGIAREIMITKARHKLYRNGQTRENPRTDRRKNNHWHATNEKKMSGSTPHICWARMNTLPNIGRRKPKSTYYYILAMSWHLRKRSSRETKLKNLAWEI